MKNVIQKNFEGHSVAGSAVYFLDSGTEDNHCFKCGESPLVPGQAFCRKCFGSGPFALVCVCSDGARIEFVIE
jgi:hypothetical protein